MVGFLDQARSHITHYIISRVGYSTMVYVEGLHVSGSLQAVVAFDRDAPFPHLASITATFVRPPDIWFSVRVLKGLRVMEVPLLKNWVHSFVMDMFTTRECSGGLKAYVYRIPYTSYTSVHTHVHVDVIG